MTTPTPITADEIESLRQLERKATQGEWRVTIADEQEAWIAAGNRRIIDCDELYEPVEANAALIAAARNAVPRLLAAIDAQAQEIARLTRERDEAQAALRAAHEKGNSTIQNADYFGALVSQARIAADKAIACAASGKGGE